jgi:CRISPR/Cas system-associated exonuclease Cas4 (RecB family)
VKSSYSRIGCYGFCPKKYEYRYVLQIPAPVKPELAFGVAIHETLEHNFVQKIDSRNDLPGQDLAVFFRDTLDNRLRPVPEEFLRGPSEPHYLRALGEHFLDQFMRERAPGLQPATRGVECSFRLPLPGDHELTGQFDLLDTDWVLHDFKTSNKPYDPRRADRTQLVIYSWACERMFGRPPKSLCFDVFVKGDGAEGDAGLQAPVIFPSPSSADMGQVARRLAGILDRLLRAEERHEFPRSFEPVRCHWCEYQPRCQREWDLEGNPRPVKISLESLVP